MPHTRWRRVPICLTLATLCVGPIALISHAWKTNPWDLALAWLILAYIFIAFAMLLE